MPTDSPDDRSLAERVRDRFGPGADPRVSLEGGPDASAGPDEAIDPALLEALQARGPSSTRYALKGKVAEGGMGVILRVFDRDLRRHLAMKVMLEDRTKTLSRLPRFLEEAQVTGQLDHPGIVPVHELGLDASGRVFFTMKLVKGETLRAVFDRVAAGEEGWSVTRGVSILQRVCEAMAFAHEKGVIHRDLKPPNVMVGRHGEVYVMDWGLARVLGQTDRKDLRLRPEQTASVVRTERRESAGASPDSPLLTEDGDVVGTPAYMPPEQARGEIERLGPASDVYAVGAMLYHLLAGRVPYVEPGTNPSPYTILAMVAHGPPAPLHSLAKAVPAELQAICERAMARRIEDRYASMVDLARDLRAYLEHRVVSAYETGAVAEMRKWVARNRGLAAAAAAAVLIALAGTGAIAWVQKERRDEVTARKAEFDQLAGVVLLADALAAEATLYPAWPEQIPAMESWLAKDAKKLLDLKPALTRTIADLEARSIPPTEVEVGTSHRRRFEKDEDRFLHDTLSSLATSIATFETAPKAGVQLRLAWARRIGDLTLHHPKARVGWEEARAALAKADGVAASTLYAEVPIDLVPQTGLVPIGMNPVTKLWEFYDLRSACDPATGDDPAALEIPAHRDDGTVEVKEGTGIVFVLIPGGSFLQGAQSADPAEPNFDPGAEPDEKPQQVALAPYFLARHELSRAQWKRMTGGGEPSVNRNGNVFLGDSIALGWTHPVESVSWNECERWLGRHGLALPTEAQWERGARGGTPTPWWTGPEASSLAGAANVLDRRAEQHVPGWGRQMGDFDDGFAGLAPVGRFRANPFGLFDVAGNLAEWCWDGYGAPYTRPRLGDGLREPAGTAYRVFRGGGFGDAASLVRSAYRVRDSPSVGYSFLGVRPARRLSTE